MRAARNSQGFLRHARIGPRKVIGLTTNCQIDEEIFASLEYLSEIPENGKAFLQNRLANPNNFEQRFQLFQSFLRQAKTFYESSRHLHFRASPLNLYYSFLNLAKCLISLSDHNAVNNRVGHGIHHAHSSVPFAEQALHTRAGVFPLLYKSLIGTELPDNMTLNVVGLLSYCTDISHEYETAGFGSTSIFPVMLRVQSGASASFCTIAIPKFQIIESRPKVFQALQEHFEEVDANKDRVREHFELYAEQKAHHRFFETREEFADDGEKIPVSQILGACYGHLKPYYLSCPYKDKFTDFYFCLPQSEEDNYPFNEVLAIYAAMFYLGSLVRYFPSVVSQ